MKLDSEEWKSISTIAEDLKVTPETVRYHLVNMQRERLVEREPDGPGWRLGEIDQLSLTEFLKKKRRPRKKKKSK
jgi:DNA-binding IclR family transcriptional regulator